MVDKRLRGATSGATNVTKLRQDGLTDKQRVFVKIYAENEGRLTPTECARQAGYNEGGANVVASQLLNGKRFPKVVDAVIKKRAEIEKVAHSLGFLGTKRLLLEGPGGPSDCIFTMFSLGFSEAKKIESRAGRG